MERCSSCGNDVVFEPKSHSLMCPSCKEIKKIDFDVFKPYKKGLNAQDETNEMVYECECEGCGHSLSFDKSSITFECPYCGKDTVIDNFKYDISGIIPFYNDRHDLEINYKNWISKKIFAPSNVKKLAFIDNFKGHYLPCYVFDSKTYTSYHGKYAETRTRTVGSGKNRRVETYTVYIPFSGNRNDDIVNDMVIGSNVVSNNVLSMIEPYDYNRLEKYNEYYIYGYTVNNYTLNKNEAFNLAKVEMENIIRNNIHASTPKRISSLYCDVTYNNVVYLRYLLPMYSCVMNYKGKEYTFYMNGQTGKVWGNAPISAIKVTIFVIILLLVIGLITFLVVSD